MNSIDMFINWHISFIGKFSTNFSTIIILLYIVYNIELYTILFFFDDGIQWVLIKVDIYYQSNKLKLIANTNKFIKTFRLIYLIKKALNIIRPNYVRYKIPPNDELIDIIISETTVDKILSKLSFFVTFRVQNIASGVLIILTFARIKKVPMDFLWLKNIDLSKIDLKSSLSMIGPIITVVLLIVAWRYVGYKGQLVRALSKSNRNHFEKVIETHRKLQTNIGSIIYQATKNLEYAILNKERIIEAKIKKVSPFIKSIENQKVVWREYCPLRDESFDFENIPEIEALGKTLGEAENNCTLYSLPWFLRFKYDLRNIYAIAIFSKNYEELKNDLNYRFFTATGFKQMLANNDYFESKFKDLKEVLPPEFKRENIERNVIEEINKFELALSYNIIHGLETIIKLTYYFNSCYKLLSLDNNKLNRWLTYIINRE